jgi:xylulokinase
MGYVIGADVGSQSVKALLMSADGTEVAAASAPCAISLPAPGWAEQRPEEWIDALARTVREVRARAGVGRDEVETIGLACQVDGLVPLDAGLEPLRPAIIWADRRATRESSELSGAVGEAELVRRTGLNPDASHTAPKAMWLRGQERALFDRTRWLAPVGGYLPGWLAGAVVQDHANASSTLLYDVGARDWSARLVDLAGLDRARLPPIRPAADLVGTLRAEAAEELDLTTGCRVVVGTGDDHAAALGAGALGPGVVVDITGTAEPVAAPSCELVLDEERLVETHAHAVEDMLLVENPGFVSGGSTRWLAGVAGVQQDQVFAQAELAPPGCDGVLFLPSLSGATAPRWNDRMRGAFAGLAMNNGFAHLARAVLEGCAFALRDVVERLAALGLCGDGEIRVVGGGARSPLWLQIKADVTGRPVRALLGGNATATGAAMLAAVASGHFRDLGEAASRCVRLAPGPVVPRPELAETYAAAYAAYCRLFDRVEGALT